MRVCLSISKSKRVSCVFLLVLIQPKVWGYVVPIRPCPVASAQQPTRDLQRISFQNSRGARIPQGRRPTTRLSSADPNTTAPTGRTFAGSRLRIFNRLYRWTIKKWHQWRRLIRKITEGHTVYVIECEGGKYYVGSTSHRKQRWQQHQQVGGGSVWTKKHKPIQIIKEYRRIPQTYIMGMESQVTAELMLQYGVNNVRGAMFAQARNYTIQDLEALVGFMGHYNQLAYGSVRQQLAKMLPPATKVASMPVKSRSEFEKRSQLSDKSLTASTAETKNGRRGPRCLKCGEYGHMKKDCPDTDVTCFICGEKGHKSFECPVDSWTEIDGFGRYNSKANRV